MPQRRTPRMSDPVWVDGEIICHGSAIRKASVEIDRKVFERAVGITNDRPQRAQASICINVRTALSKQKVQMGYLNFYTGPSNDDRFYFIIRSARASGVAWEFRKGKLVGEVPPSPLSQHNSQVEQALNWALDETFQDFQEAHELFPEYFGQRSASFNSEAGCGCVPSRVTER
jgi:hypothetical protein